jgi:hypothetical protein
MCFVACNQFFSTSPVYYLREKSTLKLVRCLTVISICCGIIFGILTVIYFNIIPSIGCIIINSKFLFYYSFIHFPLLFVIFPIFISSVQSFLAFRNVRHIIRRQIPIVRRGRNQQLTAMILMRIIGFVIIFCVFI